METEKKFEIIVYKVVESLICPFAFLLSLWTLGVTVMEVVQRSAFAEYKWSLLFAFIDLANTGLLWYGLANFKKIGLWLSYFNLAVMIIMRIIAMYQQKSMDGLFLTIIFAVVLVCFIRIRDNFN